MDFKQKIVLKIMMENGCSLGMAMRKAGYSYAYSRNPQKIKRTKLWKKTIIHTFDDEILLEKTKELLNATKSYINNEGAIISQAPNYKVRLKVLDMIYKIKGHYPSKQITKKSVNDYMDWSLAELDQEIAKLERKFK